MCSSNFRNSSSLRDTLFMRIKWPKSSTRAVFNKSQKILRCNFHVKHNEPCIFHSKNCHHTAFSRKSIVWLNHIFVGILFTPNKTSLKIIFRTMISQRIFRKSEGGQKHTLTTKMSKLSEHSWQLQLATPLNFLACTMWNLCGEKN